MLIGIEAERANSALKTGVEHYAKQLILHLAKTDQTNQYALYLRTRPEDWFFKLPKNFKVKVMPFPIFWTQVRISWEMLVHPVDALFIPASALPLIHPKKSFVTIHDLAWLFYPKTFTWFNRNFLRWSTRFAVMSAFKVIAVSESTKKDLIRCYKIPESKIAVIHHGFSFEDVGAGLGRPTSLAGAQAQPLPGHYILFLSTLQPRKNLERLIDAFVELKKEYPELNHKLVVAGKTGWKFEAILKKIAEHKSDVIYLGHVPDNVRFDVLSNADLLLLPSLYEGFGMQILESFAAGVPVATARTSSLPEVAGDAAVYFNPKDTHDIKTAIKSVLFDKSLAENLRLKGRLRLKMFSWEKCAQETLNILES